MNTLVRNAASGESALVRASSHLNSAYGRSPAYRRLASQLSQRSGRDAPVFIHSALPSAGLSPLRSPFLPAELRIVSSPFAQSRLLHSTSPRLQDGKPKADTKEPEPAVKAEAEQSEPKQDQAKSEDGEKSESKSEGEEGQEEGKDGKEKKEDLPPPPPHGDKSPWEVFMETMNTEFQKSKEWNESTKQIGAAAHQFSESESVRRAREAYEKSTGAISSTTSAAVKTTATAIGKGASWTWETPVMKGVRKAAGVTGDAVDKATKPIRDTEAFKNVKSVIDDGSSSRYGGWVDKEERRRQRELREQKEGKTEVLQEDPE
jgi:import inner membrane translocase subunit TIM44